MVVEVRLKVRHRGCFTEKLAGLAQGAQLAADRDADLLVLHGADAGSLDVLLRLAGDERGRADVLSRTPTSAVVRVRGAPHATTALIASRATILWPVLFVGGEEVFTLLAPSRAHLDELAAALAPLGPVTLERVTEATPAQLATSVPLADLTTNLTERQLAVLQTAIEQGYYDSPRRTSTEALAAAFGVTRSTLEEHLRKAERRVLEAFAGVLAAQPVLARTAARRPGRPAMRAAQAR